MDKIFFVDVECGGLAYKNIKWEIICQTLLQAKDSLDTYLATSVAECDFNNMKFILIKPNKFSYIIFSDAFEFWEIGKISEYKILRLTK